MLQSLVFFISLPRRIKKIPLLSFEVKDPDFLPVCFVPDHLQWNISYSRQSIQVG
jgi:hypothetical protein